MKFERFVVSDFAEMGEVIIHEIPTGYEYYLKIKKNPENRIASISLSGGILGNRRTFFGEFVNSEYTGDEYMPKYFENEELFLELGVNLANGDPLHLPVGEAFIDIKNYVLTRVVETNLAQKNNIEELKD